MSKINIIYVFDPLCGWCYGFASVLNRIRNEFNSDFNFDIISGGLVIGIRICKIGEKAKYLKRRMPDVERITGVKFGQPFYDLLDKGEYLSDSEPPSIAFKVLKSFRPDIGFEIGHAIQEAHYLHGKDLNNVKTYFDIAEKFEINKFGFMENYQDHAYKQETLDDFKRTKNWGVENYPSIVFDNNGVIEPVIEGYVDYDSLKTDLEDILKETER